jgi:putative endonuclease
MDKKSIGNNGENIAANYLSKIGYQIIDRNVVKNGVEADIIAMDKRIMVIVEVKTKTATEYGQPEEMVTYFKQKQLKRFAKSVIAEQGWIPLRIDVIGVTMLDNGPQIEHIISAVED